MPDDDLMELVRERLEGEDWAKFIACGHDHKWKQPVKDDVLGWAKECAACGCWQMTEPLN
jgi:hypothetical protein